MYYYAADTGSNQGIGPMTSGIVSRNTTHSTHRQAQVDMLIVAQLSSRHWLSYSIDGHMNL